MLVTSTYRLELRSSALSVLRNGGFHCLEEQRGHAGVVVQHSALGSEYKPGASSPRAIGRRGAAIPVTFCGRKFAAPPGVALYPAFRGVRVFSLILYSPGTCRPSFGRPDAFL